MSGTAEPRRWSPAPSSTGIGRSGGRAIGLYVMSASSLAPHKYAVLSVTLWCARLIATNNNPDRMGRQPMSAVGALWPIFSPSALAMRGSQLDHGSASFLSRPDCLLITAGNDRDR